MRGEEEENETSLENGDGERKGFRAVHEERMRREGKLILART
jgi:hypothetical protein